MKKILIILSFSLFASSNLFAESSKLNKFNLWLYENGYHQYLTMKENPVCKTEPKYSNLWYYNKCDKFQGSNNLNIKINNKEQFVPSQFNWHRCVGRDYMAMAKGNIHFARYGKKLKPWDHAPGNLITSEAGLFGAMHEDKISYEVS